jgi:hypothetical protein
LLAGGITVGGVYEVAIYSLAQRRIIARREEESMAAPRLNLRFLPDGRHLALVRQGEAVVLLDLALRALRTIYDAPGNARLRSLSLSRDGRWLSIIETADESDIWLMTLDEEPPP